MRRKVSSALWVFAVNIKIIHIDSGSSGFGFKNKDDSNMATYFESGVGKAILHVASDSCVALGRLAASEALSQITHFQPSLALAFISPELEIFTACSS